MARATMAEIIEEVRRLANAGTADTTLAGVTYWSDDQLQEIAERHGREFRRVALSPLSTYVDGATEYKDYPLPIHDNYRIEREGVDSGFAIRTASGTTPPSYTISWSRRMVTFASNTNGVAFYLDCRAYNVYSAVADVYEAKAGFVSAGVDWSSDNHNIKASQEHAHYKAEAMRYRAMSGGLVTMARRVRTDERY